MKTKRILITLLLSACAATAAVAQDKSAKIDQLLKGYYDNGQLNGSVLVAENGKVVYKNGFGMANMEWDIPNRPDTKFRIGSVTKQFTAALILQLVEQGKIKLDGKIADYLPDYRKDTGSRITIHQLLNHTSGIPSYTGLPTFFAEESRDPYAPAAFVKKFASGDLEFEPGSKFVYNNSGYYLLGAIIETVSGKPFAEVVQEKIFTPLAMKDSGYDTWGTIIKNRATGYTRTGKGYINAPYIDMSLPYAAGSLYSTVEDLLKWDQALYGTSIVSEESKKLMYTPGLSNYGYGFDIVETPLANGKKTRLIFHTGGINGFNSIIKRLPDVGQTVIVLDNVGLGRYHESITNGVVAILNGMPYTGSKKSIVDLLLARADEKGAADAITEYKKLKAERAAVYDFAEPELNTLGYQLMARGKVKDAIEIFKLNVEMFPASANPYDSLGEAYLADGQRELALTNYKKALAIDPENSSSLAAVARLEGKEVKLDAAALAAFVGDYEIAPGFVLTITSDGTALAGQATGQGKLDLVAIGEDKFAAPAARGEITFERTNGTVTALTLNQGGRQTKAKKTK